MPESAGLPLPVRALAAVLVVGFVGAGAWQADQALHGVELWAYNGHDRAVRARVGGWSAVVDPGELALVEGAREGVLTVEVSTLDDRVVDLAQVSLHAPGDRMAVLNLNRRGVLVRQTRRYIADQAEPRPPPPPAPELLAVEDLSLVEPIDHLFTAPAARDFNPSQRFADATVLLDLSREEGLPTAVSALMAGGDPVGAASVVVAELELDPDDRAALSMARGVLANDPRRLADLARTLREQAPESVEVHRLYQDAGGAEAAALQAEYAALAEQHAESALYTYLWGRTLPLLDPRAEAAFDRALQLDPALAPARLARGNLALASGDLALAEEHLAGFAATASAHADQVLGDRVRAALAGGVSPWSAQTQAILAHTTDQGGSPMLALAMALRLRAAGSEAPLERLEAEAAGSVALAGRDLAGLRWLLAFARGDLARAEQALGEATPAWLASPEGVQARWMLAWARGDAAAVDAVVVEHADGLAARGLPGVLLPAAWAKARGLPVAEALMASAKAVGGEGNPAWVLDGADPRLDPRAALVPASMRPRMHAAAAVLAASGGQGDDATALASEAQRWALPGELPPSVSAAVVASGAASGPGPSP